MDDRTSPLRLDLDKARHLAIDWKDGRKCLYPLELLRKMCPCAACKGIREEQERNPTRLRVLASHHEGPLTVLNAELVGGYALRIDWSDQHGTGIYSFEYLRKLCELHSR